MITAYLIGPPFSAPDPSASLNDDRLADGIRRDTSEAVLAPVLEYEGDRSGKALAGGVRCPAPKSRGSRVLGDALVETERRVDTLKADIDEPASEVSEAGSSSFLWWRRGESNPRPKRPNVEILHAQSGLVFLAAASSGPDDRARQRT